MKDWRRTNLSVIVDTVRDFLDAVGDELVAVDLLELPDFVGVVNLIDP